MEIKKPQRILNFRSYGRGVEFLKEINFEIARLRLLYIYYEQNINGMGFLTLHWILL
jgi:hypothetical protein